MPATDPHALRRHSVRVNGHNTSFSVENLFWDELGAIAARRRMTVRRLVIEIAERPRQHSLSSAIRVAVLSDALRRAEG